MPNPVPATSILNYGEALEKVKLEDLLVKIKGVSGDQSKAIDSIAKFLVEYLNGGVGTKKTADSQNVYFSRKQIEDFKKILEKNSTIQEENLEALAKSALESNEELSKKVSESKDSGFYSKIVEQLKTILQDTKKASGENAESSKQSSATSKISSIFLKKVKEINQRLNKSILASVSFGFAHSAIDIDSKVSSLSSITRVKFFTQKIGMPDLKAFKDRHVKFEEALTRNLSIRIRYTVRKFSKQLSKYLYIVVGGNLISGALKIARFGIKTIVWISKAAFFVASNAIRLVSGILSFTVKTATFLLGKTVSTLWNISKKIASFKIFKFTFKLFEEFFKTYAGAYVLGYLAGFIYGRFEKVFSFVKGFIENIKSKFEEYLKDTAFGKALGTIGFTASELRLISTDDDLDLVGKLDSALDLFTLRDSKTGGKAFSLGVDDLIQTMKEIRDAFNQWTSADFYMDLAINVAPGFIGGIAGSTIGAIVGQAIIPIPILGGVIGSIVGGWIGEKLGGTIKKMIRGNVPLSHVATGESKFDKFLRTHGFGPEFSLFGGDSTLVAHEPTRRKNQFIDELNEYIAEQDENFKLADFLDEIDKENPEDEAAARFKARFKELRLGTSVRDVFSGKTSIAKQLEDRKKIAEFISSIRIDAIEQEINMSLDRLKELYDAGLLDSSNNKAIYLHQFKPEDRQTDIVLKGTTGELSVNQMANPLWFKIFRALKLRNMVWLYQKHPDDFLNFMESKDFETFLANLDTYNENDPFLKQFKVKRNDGSENMLFSELIRQKRDPGYSENQEDPIISWLKDPKYFWRDEGYKTEELFTLNDEATSTVRDENKDVYTAKLKAAGLSQEEIDYYIQELTNLRQLGLNVSMSAESILARKKKDKEQKNQEDLFESVSKAMSGLISASEGEQIEAVDKAFSEYFGKRIEGEERFLDIYLPEISKYDGQKKKLKEEIEDLIHRLSTSSDVAIVQQAMLVSRSGNSEDFERDSTAKDRNGWNEHLNKFYPDWTP